MSGVIKAGRYQAGGDDLRSVAFNFEDISDKAKLYLDEVRRQAAQILAEAKQRAKQMEDEAKEMGQQAALQEAEQRLQSKRDQQLQSLLPAMEQAVESILHSQHAWLKHWEQQTVHLAAAIAQRVIRRELSQQPEIRLDLIREALELAMGGGRLRMHLNPADHQALGQQMNDITAQFENLAPADVVADPNISLGGCRIVTEFGSIDHQIESQIARIEEELT